jgi:hypothetical protein
MLQGAHWPPSDKVLPLKDHSLNAEMSDRIRVGAPLRA